MKTATADQYRSYLRRWIGATLIEILAVLLAGSSVILVFVILGDRGAVPKLIAAASLLLVFCAGQVVSRAYFRCPICNAVLPRGQKQVRPREFFNGHCNQCGTKFIRQAAQS